MTLQMARLSNDNESAQSKFQIGYAAGLDDRHGIGMAVTLGVGLRYFGTGHST